jgi:hypothetical protein
MKLPPDGSDKTKNRRGRASGSRFYSRFSSCPRRNRPVPTAQSEHSLFLGFAQSSEDLGDIGNSLISDYHTEKLFEVAETLIGSPFLKSYLAF